MRLFMHTFGDIPPTAASRTTPEIEKKQRGEKKTFFSCMYKHICMSKRSGLFLYSELLYNKDKTSWTYKMYIKKNNEFDLKKVFAEKKSFYLI